MSHRAIDPVILLKQAMVGTLKSLPLNIQHLSLACFQMAWDGAPTGTFGVEGSCDGTVYTDMGIPIAPMAGAPNSSLVNLTGMAINFVRISVVLTAGAGNITVLGSAKGGGS